MSRTDTGLTTPARRLLHGWGRTAPTAASVSESTPVDELAGRLEASSHRGVIARGLGRAYNDAAQNAGGAVVLLPASRNNTDVDPATGIVDVAGGCSIDELLTQVAPRGWFVPVTPGTRQVTIGGAVAADIHGKNHHVDGSIGVHVIDLDLLGADGTLRTIGPDSEPSLYWATVGGMGLTGIITRVRLRLKPIGSSMVSVDTDRTRDLAHTLELLDETADDYRYSVSWIDLLTRGRSMGRAVVTQGDFAPRERVGADPLRFVGGDARVPTPPWTPGGLLNRRTLRMFNEAWFRRMPAHRRDELQSIGAFFHPLDGLKGWNHLYGPAGFIQWQCVVPFEHTDVFENIIGRLVEAQCPSFLAVLKRFGAANPAPLSFPMPGWTLALDTPADPALAPLFDELDELVVSAGGRLYLAKDGRMRPELLPVMYPRLDEWLDIRHTHDPHCRFRSDMARRLGLL